MGDDEVGVLLADLRAADPKALERRLIDQRAGAEAARVLEDAAGVLGVQRLAVLLVHPDLLGPLHDLIGVVLFQFEHGHREDERGAVILVER